MLYRVLDGSGKCSGFYDGDRKDYIQNCDMKYAITRNKYTGITVKSNGTFKIQKGSVDKEDYSHKKVRKLMDDKLWAEDCLQNDAFKFIRGWMKDKNNRTLYLYGTKGIGKTYAVKALAYAKSTRVVYIDMTIPYIAKSVSDLLKKNGSLDRFLPAFCSANGLAFHDTGDVTVILDEAHKSVELSKMFIQDKKKVKCRLAIVTSYPGYMEEFIPDITKKCMSVEMIPCSFKSFYQYFKGKLHDWDKLSLWTNNIIDENIVFKELYERYLEYGGYPSVISKIKKKYDMNPVDNSIRTELVLPLKKAHDKEFMDLLRKLWEYSDVCISIDRIYNALLYVATRQAKGAKPSELFGELYENEFNTVIPKEQIERILRWLDREGLIGYCKNFRRPGQLKHDGEKIYFKNMAFLRCFDIEYMRGIDPRINMMGYITESFVYTELYRVCQTNTVKENYPCFILFGEYELDFVVTDVKSGKVVGIEVKSRNGKCISLEALYKKKIINAGYVVKPCATLKKGFRFKTVPIYLVGSRFPYM